MEMETLWLKLTVLQGPREGETFEFPPKSRVRIGRVVKGNSLTIKDEGISSKHLFIGSQPSGKWIVQDLESSNGTTLNSTSLTPSDSFDLHHGDTLKLGEKTTILVQFSRPSEVEPSQLRRNPRRNVNESAMKIIDKEGQNSSIGDNNVVIQERRTRRGRLPKARVSDDKELEIEKVNSRVTRNEKNDEVNKELNVESKPVAPVVVKTEELEESVVVEKQRRRGRPKKAPALDDNELGNMSFRVTRNRKKEDCNAILENACLEGPHMKGKKASSRVTRSRKNETSVVLENLDGNMAGRHRGSGRNSLELKLQKVDFGLDLVEEATQKVNEVDIGKDEEEEEKERLDADMECANVGDDIIVNESVDLGRDVREDVKDQINEVDISRVEDIKCENQNSFKERDGKGQVKGSGDLGKGEELRNLDNMTLGQWFQYIEAHMPKQIIQATEEMIVEMRIKAERVKEYIIEQKKAKVGATTG